MDYSNNVFLSVRRCIHAHASKNFNKAGHASNNQAPLQKSCRNRLLGMIRLLKGKSLHWLVTKGRNYSASSMMYYCNIIIGIGAYHGGIEATRPEA